MTHRPRATAGGWFLAAALLLPPAAGLWADGRRTTALLAVLLAVAAAGIGALRRRNVRRRTMPSCTASRTAWSCAGPTGGRTRTRGRKWTPSRECTPEPSRLGAGPHPVSCSGARTESAWRPSAIRPHASDSPS
ncbi:hypothetical protein [Streptomyces hydrogenans]|uniref:hypothetical protein n=1 Tax=Streptomyces hydrogenans TaxID=1873719 RepID=UPI00278C3E32|nr:hypothetical protein [Streptomyces hydrogenans]